MRRSLPSSLYQHDNQNLATKSFRLAKDNSRWKGFDGAKYACAWTLEIFWTAALDESIVQILPNALTTTEGLIYSFVRVVLRICLEEFVSICLPVTSAITLLNKRLLSSAFLLKLCFMRCWKTCTSRCKFLRFMSRVLKADLSNLTTICIVRVSQRSLRIAMSRWYMIRSSSFYNVRSSSRSI